MIYKIDWTEICNIAGQLHNKKMFGNLTEQDENAGATEILKLLHLAPQDIIEKIGEIESLVAEPGHIGFDDKKNEQIDSKCFDLRYMLTNVIGE